jgi:hypothetical protein
MKKIDEIRPSIIIFFIQFIYVYKDSLFTELSDFCVLYTTSGYDERRQHTFA